MYMYMYMYIPSGAVSASGVSACGRLLGAPA